MAQHDYSIANQSGAAFRADVNNALQAIVSNNSGASGPSTTYAHQIWFDTSTSPVTIRQRDASNAAWFLVGTIDANVQTFSVNGAERMRIDSAGRVGIGTIPGSDLLEIAAATDPKIRFIDIGNTDAKIGMVGSTALGFEVNGAERMRIDSNGRVGIGTTGPGSILDVRFSTNPAVDNGTGQNVLRVWTTSALAADAGGAISLGGTATSAPLQAAFGQIAGRKENATSADYAGYLQFAVNNTGGTMTEAARFDSAGRLLVGTTVGAPYPGVAIGPTGTFKIGNSNGADGWGFVDFLRNGASIGTITQSGTTGVAYNTSSDYRLKENVSAVQDGIARLKQLNPCRFNFIADPDTIVDGFIAHEAQAVVPECVTGEKDAEHDDGTPIYQGIDQSKLVPLLTAALQEAIAKIETLESKVAALESA
jgi:hypothetical protein